MYTNDVFKIAFRTSTVQIAPLIAVIVRTAGHVLQTRVCVQMAVRMGGPGATTTGNVYILTWPYCLINKMDNKW